MDGAGAGAEECMREKRKGQQASNKIQMRP